jgi:hypothetical protein
MAGSVLGFARAISFENSTKHFLTENGQALALLADDGLVSCDAVIDRMTHRSALALVRAPTLMQEREQVIDRILLDIQAGRALVQLKELAPKISPELQQALHKIRSKLALYFSGRDGLRNMRPTMCADIREFTQKIDHGDQTSESMRLMGLMESLRRGIQENAT